MTKRQYLTIKLSTSDNVIGELIHEDQSSVILKNPLIMIKLPTQTIGVPFASLSRTKNSIVTFNGDNIVCRYVPDKDVQKSHKKIYKSFFKKVKEDDVIVHTSFGSSQENDEDQNTKTMGRDESFEELRKTVTRLSE